ncbi:MAG: sugar transferase [Terracidiphilus sp.]
MRLFERLNRDLYCRFGKRIIDTGISAVGLIVLAPLLFATALAIRIVMGRPVLFRQARPGLNERVFELIKFRTMSDQRDSCGQLLPDAARVTWIGSLLRATSLDEVPELWNVLKGEMSLVGPRPLLVEYLPYYSSREQKRHSVRPGITGLAQVSGRNDTTWRQRLDHDVDYVDNFSLILDFQIIVKTIFTILRGDGGIAPIEKLGRFRGSGGDVKCDVGASKT